jgi:hypothetical protein
LVIGDRARGEQRQDEDQHDDPHSETNDQADKRPQHDLIQ